MTWAPGRGLPRWLEVGLAATALFLLAPVLLVIGVAVRVTSAGPALFRQPRVGRHGALFTLRKFRTMRHRSDGPQVTATGDPRITPIGRLLRRSKLDELPELWNILAGEMSIVGPRPEVPDAVDLDSELWSRVLSARPGLTDPVTLRLRDEASLLAAVPEPERPAFYHEVLQPWKLRGYVAYLEDRSPWTDCRVIVATLWAILAPASAKAPTLDEIRASNLSPSDG